MHCNLKCSLWVLTSLILVCCGISNPQDLKSINVTNDEKGLADRARLIEQATSWLETTREQIAQRDIIRGPEDAQDFAPCELDSGQIIVKQLNCSFVRPDDPDFEPQGGRTPKFLCRLPGKKKPVKIKYYKLGEKIGNAEVFSEVAGSRLLWALGFPADRVHPVGVNCQGCPDDPWEFVQNVRPGDESLAELDPSRMVRFAYSAIESKYDLQKIKVIDKESGAEVLDGWTFAEAFSGSPSPDEKINRQVLAALNSLLYNLDAKVDNQRLVCREEHEDGRCLRAELMVHDIGFTFGGDPVDPFRKKVHYGAWKWRKVFRNAGSCDISNDVLGFGISLSLSEAARIRLVELLTSLSERQRINIFRVARFGVFPGAIPESYGRRYVRVDQYDEIARLWSDVLADKIEQLKSVTCPR